MERLDSMHAQRLLKRKCLVVQGMPVESRGFTQAGLRTLASLDSVIFIQGISSCLVFSKGFIHGSN